MCDRETIARHRAAGGLGLSEEALRQPDEPRERASSAPSSNGPLCSHTSAEHALEQIIQKNISAKTRQISLACSGDRSDEWDDPRQTLRTKEKPHEQHIYNRRRQQHHGLRQR